MVSPRLRKEAVVVMRSEVAVSERRACGLIQIHSGDVSVSATAGDGELRVRLRELAEERTKNGGQVTPNRRDCSIDPSSSDGP
jgi:hypothetical protein